MKKFRKKGTEWDLQISYIYKAFKIFHQDRLIAATLRRVKVKNIDKKKF